MMMMMMGSFWLSFLGKMLDTFFHIGVKELLAATSRLNTSGCLVVVSLLLQLWYDNLETRTGQTTCFR